MEGTFIIEIETDSKSNMWRVESFAAAKKSKFQKVEVVDLGRYGMTLFLDELIQSSEFDEYVYHESLVHPCMLAHPNPVNVFIGGGGEGGTLREVLRHKSVQKCVMVDIDQFCVETCREHLPMFHQGSYDDPRTVLIFDDAKKYLEETEEVFDVIILDLADPIHGGPCELLYTQEFYTHCLTKLSPNGILITQAGPCSNDTYREMFLRVYHTLVSVADGRVIGNNFFVKTFCDNYSTVAAHKSEETLKYDKLSPEEKDALIQERLSNPEKLRYYDGEIHLKDSLYPKEIREAIKNFDEKNIITPGNIVDFHWE